MIPKIRAKTRERIKALTPVVEKQYRAFMKNRPRAIAIITAVSLLIGALIVMFIGEEIQAMRTVKVSGTIEGNDVRIAFRVQGRIESLLADEGIVVKNGDIVARLDTDELAKIAANAQAALRAQEYQAKLARDDYIRAENLFKAGSISTQQRDTARTNADAAMAKEESLRAELELARTRLGFAYLDSPLNGFILVKSAEQGEVVQAGSTVFTAVNLDDVWVTAYLNERDLGKVKLNQKAYVKIDSFPRRKYDGWVSFISQQAEFTPKYIQTTEERVKLVYRVKVRVDNSTLVFKPGMPADAYIIID